jgi:adenine-specific DNA-methyltransferase
MRTTTSSQPAYENKIGLTSNGKFLSDNTDVVLDFPYKDTVLKASMSKEDRKREDLLPNEPFYNEKMAREEIDTLLDKKVLINVTKYDKQGSHEESVFTKNDNLILRGNNLFALHTIENHYKGKVKLIYIDPPYNLKSDSFKYNDKFTRSTWLTFMKNRLQIAATLLSEKGSIWISISDEEMHYLKVLMDEVFGEDSFVATLPRKTRDGKSDVPFNLSQDFDWLLVYTKGSVEDALVGRSVRREYYETDDFPGRPWRKADMTKQTTVKERPNSDFTMVNPKTGKEYPVNPKRSWAVTKDTFNEYYDKGGIGFPDDYDFMSGNRPFRRVFKEEDDQNIKPTYVSSDFLIKDFFIDIVKRCQKSKRQ